MQTDWDDAGPILAEKLRRAGVTDLDLRFLEFYSTDDEWDVRRSQDIRRRLREAGVSKQELGQARAIAEARVR